MKEKKQVKFLNDKKLTEYNKMISDIEQNMYQRDHWKRQQIYWAVIAAIAVTVLVMKII